jgi:hypothetical protein
MTLESIKGVKARAYESEKWTLKEGEGERVFIAKGRAVTDPYEAVNCFTKAIKSKVRP